MRKELKQEIVESLSAQLAQTPNFYVVDIAGLNAEDTSALRRDCFEQNIKLSVVKNTLLTKALEALGNDEVKAIIPILEGPTAVMFSDSVNAPAKLIKKRKDAGNEKPLLKGAYVQECAFVGADKLDALCNIKSKEELLGEIIGMLQSPLQNVISGLEGAGNKIAGILKTLGEKE